jgi:hypothetical protein
MMSTCCFRVAHNWVYAHVFLVNGLLPYCMSQLAAGESLAEMRALCNGLLRARWVSAGA